MYVIAKDGDRCELDENRVHIFACDGTLFRKGKPVDDHVSYEVFNLFTGYSAGSWGRTYRVQPVRLIEDDVTADRDRLTAENAELRGQLKESELEVMKWQQGSDFYESELAAANATLDALRDLCGPNRTISNSTCMKVVDLLYPQPKETGDADE